MNKVKLYFTSLIVLFSTITFAQGVSVNTTGAPPDSTSMLDVSSQAKGFLMPRLTTTQRNGIHNPASSLLIYNTTTNCFETYGLGYWQTLYCLCSSTPSVPGAITGSTTLCDSTSATYSIASVSGASSYTWTAPSGSTILSGQGTTSVTIYFGNNSGNVSVTANNNCGASAASTLSVTVNLPPATPGSITGPVSVTASQTNLVYSISPVTGATSYTWSVPTGASIISGGTTNSITVTWGSTGGNVCVVSNNACGSSSSNSCLNVSLAVTITKIVFTAVDSNQHWTVPAGVTSINVKLWAASGGSYWSSGGTGGYVAGKLAVTPGQILTIIVGKGGTNGATVYGGGGTSPSGGANGGGGRSAIQITAGVDAVTAGGGGGAGGADFSNPLYGSYGGAGGGSTGGSGATGGGTGGTQSAGGAFGCNAGRCGMAGSSQQGGQGCQTYASGCEFGGGGGGGYFGGGGGGGESGSTCGNPAGGGGGGSSYVANLTGTVVNTSGSTNSSGGAISAPNNSDPDYMIHVDSVPGGPSNGYGGEVVIY